MERRCGETPPVPSNGESVTTKLQRIAEKARSDPKFRFTSLFHLMDVELLRGCFASLRGDASAGIDQVTKAQYAQELEANLADLVDRLHRMSYHPQPVRRVYIPKPGSRKRRSIGIPTLEDKLVQAGLARILASIYEQDFIDDSYGSRPGRCAHDVLRELGREVDRGQIHYIAEADIRGFFDAVELEWQVRFLSHRIADKRVLRYIQRFLKAGIVEDGIWRASERGVPQGGTISPILANIYLHYALDLWFERRFRKTCRGPARLIRYADDFVAGFHDEADAYRFQQELTERLAAFGLEVEPSKTRVLAFSPREARRARARGERLQTFDFLGFTHYCAPTRDGTRFRVKRKTSCRRFTAKLKALKLWLKKHRMLPTRELMAQIQAKLRGHVAYYGVTDNTQAVQRFLYEARQLLFKWLNRRGGRKPLRVVKFALLMEQFPFPTPRVVVSLF